MRVYYKHCNNAVTPRSDRMQKRISIGWLYLTAMIMIAIAAYPY